LLRAKTVNLLAIDRADEARAAVVAALVADPESGAFQEIHAVVLEHEGASVADVRAAYQRAIEIDPDNWQALEALGRLSEGEGATDRALDFYDRATLAYPEGPSAARHAAQLAQRTGPAEQAESRWEALLREHPWDAVAAAELAKMRLTRGVSDDSVLELAERAVLFRGGIEAQKLLMRVHETRGDGDRAAEVARAIETGDPIPPRKVTSIDEV
jgi:Tfp pilus assembly protein PilF